MRRFPVLLFLLALPRMVLADQVFLKDAGSLTGRIVSQTATKVEVDVGGGIVGVPMDHVARIEKGRCALDDYEDRASKLAPSDAAGWRKLGKWANDQGLSSQAQEAYQKVLKLSPNDPEANQAFGRVELNGKWVTEEESYRARGYVEYQGEWMTAVPTEAIRTDPTRMAQGIMTGIGFLGAGVIFKEGLTIRGLTTSASIWVTAAIGILVGIGFYIPALVGTVAVLHEPVERPDRPQDEQDDHGDHDPARDTHGPIVAAVSPSPGRSPGHPGRRLRSARRWSTSRRLELARGRPPAASPPARDRSTRARRPPRATPDRAAARGALGARR